MNSKPSLGLSLLPFLLLIITLTLNVLVFKDNASYGPNQVSLMLVGLFAASLAYLFLGMTYKEMEGAALKTVSLASQALFILLAVGALIGLWIMAGVVPAMIFYGLKLIHPSVFLPVTTIICSIVSLATGSSWSTTGTVGIALMGIGQTLGFDEGLIAGAIISGAYFGDKMSPLSDTTNLAPAIAGANLFDHIRNMLVTTVPAITIALIMFTVIGLTGDQAALDTAKLLEVTKVIEGNFNIGIHLFIAPAIVLILVGKKIPALPALIIGCLVGALMIPIFQADLLAAKLGTDWSFKGLYEQVMQVSFSGFEIESGNKIIDKLFNRGGMAGMLNTIWIILAAMFFGGIMESNGMLEKITESILKLVQGVGTLVGATVTTCLLFNLTAGDQFLSIVVPGRMFKNTFEKMGLKNIMLSRTLEDAGTVTSVLIPWNSGGAYNSSVLGVATFSYLPYCFFNLLCPVIAVFFAGFGIGVRKVATTEA